VTFQPPTGQVLLWAGVISVMPFCLASLYWQGLRFVRATIATFEAEAARLATAPCRGGSAFAANALACPFARKLRAAHQALSDLGFVLELGVGPRVVVPGLCLCRFTIKHCDMARRSLAAWLAGFCKPICGLRRSGSRFWAGPTARPSLRRQITRLASAARRDRS